MERVNESVSDALYELLPQSAYDTAWVAMVGDPGNLNKPLFPKLLDWIMSNQSKDGSWSCSPESIHIECLTTTLACVLALHTWNTGGLHVHQGIRFVNENMEEILKQQKGSIPRWFAIVFPGMMELAQAKGLQVVVPQTCQQSVQDIYKMRQRHFEQDKDRGYNWPLASYVEVLPQEQKPPNEVIINDLMGLDGSLFHSPSATAFAFMATGDANFLLYLHSLLASCGDKVPSTFPVDQDFTRLCLLDHCRRLGCGDHLDVDDFMGIVHGNWLIQEPLPSKECCMSQQIMKDSLAFQLLREHGHIVSPARLCRFMDDKDMIAYIEENYYDFLGPMLCLYRATQLAFPEDNGLHKAKAFCMNILSKFYNSTNVNLHQKTKDELDAPWLARIDHLEHRRYIEENKGYKLWIGKNSSFSLSTPQCINQLAARLFSQRQLVYRKEIEELQMLSKELGLLDIGFGREKTMYCYFCCSTMINLPLSCDLRKIGARCAALVTVADDFFDEKGSIDELQKLTDSVKSWDGSNLSGHSYVIFHALDVLTCDIALRYHRLYGFDITRTLQHMWYETFEAWLVESKWSKVRAEPPTNEYLDVAKLSIAIQAMTLPICYLATPQHPYGLLASHYSAITHSVMVSSRLINDCQSYQKERENGKLNMVMLYMKENPSMSVEDSIQHIRNIIEIKDQEFLKLLFTDSSVPDAWKALHLVTLKSFHMLFDTSNFFDSETSLLQSINRAFYDPLAVEIQEKELPDYPLEVINDVFTKKFGDEMVNYSLSSLTKLGNYGRTKRLRISSIRRMSSYKISSIPRSISLVSCKPQMNSYSLVLK